MKEQKTMHCWSCGKKMAAVVGNYEYDDKCLGHLSVPCKAGELFTCDCGEAPYVGASLSVRMADYEQKRIEQLLLMSVGGDINEFKSQLIGMSELERELGVTRQAIGKTPKYRNRIYHVVMNGDLLWWKPSVALFKSKGDGRFVFGKAKPTALRRLRAFGELLREFMPLRSAAMFTF
ncbi:MAG: hypothetical protein MJ249_15040 [Kiritimatiellae bacterium]|nr:hypothetical protein [Kiritimatiellia bacterium]